MRQTEEGRGGEESVKMASFAFLALRIAHSFQLSPVYGIYYGRMNSHLGRNALFCSSRYDVVDILSVTRHMVSHYVNSHISTQHKG